MPDLLEAPLSPTYTPPGGLCRTGLADPKDETRLRIGFPCMAYLGTFVLRRRGGGEQQDPFCYVSELYVHHTLHEQTSLLDGPALMPDGLYLDLRPLRILVSPEDAFYVTLPVPNAFCRPMLWIVPTRACR